jgi:hypothetical protein
MGALDIFVQALLLGAMLVAGFQLGRTFKEHTDDEHAWAC